MSTSPRSAEDAVTDPEAVPVSQQETRDRILDAAERLFSDHGFDPVSLRRITTAAGVNVAAVNYHFGSREALISEVMARVIGPVNRERLRLLGAFEAEAAAEKREITVEEIVIAAFRPVVLDMPRSHETTHRFLRLAGRCLSEQSEAFPETMRRVFSEVTERFVDAFQRALPHLTEADIYWRMHFTIGTLLHAITQDDRLVAISKGAVEGIEPEESMAQLMAFTVAGFEAPAPARERTSWKGASRAVGMVVAFGLLGVGCAGVSPPNAEGLAEVGEVPDQWEAGGNTASVPVADHKWVSTFNDQKLEELVDEALGYNKDLAAAAARIEVAQANARIAGAELKPQASGLFRGSRAKRNFIGFPFPGEPGGGEGISSNLNNEFDLSLDMSWEVDLWGRIRAGQSAAISDAEAVSADRAAAELSIAGQVAKTWFAVEEAQEQVRLAEKAIEVFEDTETAIRDRFDAGIADQNENLASQLRLAGVDVEVARDAREQRLEDLGRFTRQLEVLLGRYPGARLKGDGVLPTLPGQPPAGMPADLLDRRPDLYAAERRLAGADQRLVEAKRALLPTISLTGSPGTASEQIEDLLDSDFSVWSIAGSVAQPILDGGRLREGVNARKGEVKEVTADFEKIALTAFSEVENALAAEGYLRNRSVALKNATDLAREAYDRAREEFADGTGDILTMLASQDRFFTQQSRRIAVERLRLENRVDLHLALGGGFQSPKVTPGSDHDS